MRNTFAALAVAATLLGPAAALADDAPVQSEGSSAFRQPDALLDKSLGKQRPLMLSFFVGLPYAYYGYGFGFGVGARFYIPILHDGFAPINDEFGIEFGADFNPTFGVNNYYFIDVPIQAMYDVHLLPNFDVYAKLGLVPTFYFGYTSGFYAGDIFAGSVGLRFKISSAFYLRAELGFPMSMIGVGFAF